MAELLAVTVCNNTIDPAPNPAPLMVTADPEPVVVIPPVPKIDKFPPLGVAVPELVGNDVGKVPEAVNVTVDPDPLVAIPVPPMHRYYT